MEISRSHPALGFSIVFTLWLVPQGWAYEYLPAAPLEGHEGAAVLAQSSTEPQPEPSQTEPSQAPPAAGEPGLESRGLPLPLVKLSPSEFLQQVSRGPTDPFQPWNDFPFLRFDESAAWDPEGRRMLIFGGALNGGPEFGAPTTPEDPTLSTPGFAIRRRLNDLWAWTEQGGFQRLQADSAQGIPRRNGASMVWDTFNHRLLVYGGNVKAQDGQHPSFTNEAWEWTQTGGWRLVMPAGSTSRPVEFDGPPPDAPALRWGASVVWDSKDNRLLVFGGYGENPVDRSRGWYHYVGTGNDLWAWRPDSTLGGGPSKKFIMPGTQPGRWFLLSDRFAQGAPPPRAGAAGVWDSTNHRLLIFGGSNLGKIGVRNPIYQGNPGVVPTHMYNDLWSWSPQSGWRLLSPDGAPDAPSGRFGVATWDAANNRLVVSWTAELIHSSTLHSTLNPGESPRDVWEWTSQRGWRRIINPNTQTIWMPTQRSILQLFFDHARPGALLASMGQVTRTVWALITERVPSVPAPKAQVPQQMPQLQQPLEQKPALVPGGKPGPAPIPGPGMPSSPSKPQPGTGP